MPTTHLPVTTAAPTGPGDRPVVLAAIVGAHGIAGEVRLKVFAEDLAAHRVFNGGALTLEKLRETPQGAIARFADVTDRTAADSLRGTELTVPRTSLPPLGDGEYYHADLLGLPVIDDAGQAVGSVVSVDDFGAGDVIEIERVAGGRVMVPMTIHAVPEWNDKRLVVARAFVEL